MIACMKRLIEKSTRKLIELTREILTYVGDTDDIEWYDKKIREVFELKDCELPVSLHIALMSMAMISKATRIAFSAHIEFAPPNAIRNYNEIDDDVLRGFIKDALFLVHTILSVYSLSYFDLQL